MALRTRTVFLLIAISLSVLASREFDVAPESDLEDIRQAAANLHNQILREKQDLVAITMNRLPSSVGPPFGAVGWAGPENQALAAIYFNRVPTSFDSSLGAVGWADAEKQALAAIDVNRAPSSFDPSLGADGWTDPEKQALAAVDINRVPASFDPPLGAVGWADPEKQALAAIDMNRLPRRFIPSLDAVGWLDPENELQLAARQQLQQTMEHQRLLEREGPTISEQLQFATERLASQRRLASSQLEQTGMVTLGSLDKLQHAVSSESTRRIPFSDRSPDHFPKRPPERGTNRSPKQPLALPQTAAKNPALAALLLEPVLYGYSAVVWALMVLFTGVASAVGLYISKSIALWHVENLQLPTAGDGGRRFSNDVSTRLNALDEEDVERVESWIKVPVHIASQSRRQDCQGFPDDEFDGEGGSFPMPTTGRPHPCGYVDDNC